MTTVVSGWWERVVTRHPLTMLLAWSALFYGVGQWLDAEYLWLPLGLAVLLWGGSIVVHELRRTRFERDGLKAVLVFSEAVSALDKATIQQEIVARMRGLTGADSCLLFMVDEEHDVLRAVAHSHDMTTYTPAYVERMMSFPCPRGFGLTGSAWVNGESMLVHDTDQSSAAKRTGLEPRDKMSNLLVPMKVRGQVIGVLRVTRTGVHRFTEQHLLIASVFANQAAVALEGSDLYAQLNRMAYTDALTGLPNARAMHDELDRLVDRRTPFGLMIVDADALKQVNDQLGHQAGDRLLIEMGEGLRQCVGSRGQVFRYAGDEFIIVTPNLTREEALSIAERIRADRSQFVMETPSGPIGTTLCVGVAGYPSDGQTPSQLMQAADQAMYRVKHSGKNGVQAAS